MRIAGACGDAVLRARAAEAWVLSISGVGFAIGEAADAELIEVLDDTVAALPADAVEHQVWLRSMLVSVLVETAQFERQERLSDEALAIAGRTNDPGLMASALYARRLALWRRDHLAQRLPISFDAIEHARRAGDVHLELTAMLVAMTDLMESGRVDEQLAMLDEFERRAATQHTPVYDVYAGFMRSCRMVVTGDYAAAERLVGEARAAGLSSHGTNTEMAHAGQMFLIAWDHGQLGDIVEFVEMTVAANPHTPIWPSPWPLHSSRLVAPRRAGACSTSSSRPMAWSCPTTRCTSRAVLPRRGGPRARRHRDARPCCSARWSRTPDASPSPASAASASGLSAATSASPPTSRGDLDAAVAHLERAIVASQRLGMRPFTAHAAATWPRPGGPRRPRRRGRGCPAGACAEAVAAEIGLVLGLF